MTAAVGDNATDKADVVDKYDISEHTEYLPLVPDPAGGDSSCGDDIGSSLVVAVGGMQQWIIRHEQGTVIATVQPL
ncbi:hypothetical protein CYMTET_27535 [Cymbomonas tetramitiformis]|uniref:Uncharacterized protein n=1 Tax=Cymbomonas tetramitiformis TaxID=36881 RepID=A0AAE0KX39_9CHLO|nr:hypothetical protein CYMTET_27534 [Cymbomonas tetramitiformis]KAK3263675.1 hypothetical protein CYMTET_27535 [Cymbomonas tetramitiformis]